MRRLPLALPLLVVTVVLAACSSTHHGEGGDNPVVSNPAVNSAANPAVASTPATSAKCAYPSDGQSPARDVGTPSTTALLAPATLTLHLALGTAKTPADVVITLKPSTAPCTVNAISYLASKKYFDGTDCHRLTTSGIDVLQCGDPTGTGGGTPGFSYADELSGEETYPAGTVAMANTGQPGTNGSQFFLVYGPTQLSANYTVFGTINSGLDVVQGIAAKGSDNSHGTGDGHPKETVEIASATLS